MTKRSASTRFDLPQPFGPTMPVEPRLDRDVGRLDEGLEAGRRRRVSFTGAGVSPPPCGEGRRRFGRGS